MFKKLFTLKNIFPIVLFLLLTSCATTQKQPIVEIETFEKPEITNNLDNSLSDLTTQITNSITEDGKKKIAVIEFSDLEGNVTQFGKYLAEELITRLFRTKKFEVVERQLLNKIISEQKLSITGMIDDVSAVAIGKILGVDAIVSGTITDLGKSLKVNARIISAKTGKVFGVAGTKIVKDETVEKLMGIISTVQKEEVQKQMEKKEISKEVLKKLEAENFTFELIKCDMSSGGNVTCDFLITNNDKDRELIFFTKRSRMFDDFGNEYEPSKGELANKQVGSRSDTRSLLISGISTKANLTFKNVTQEASGISLLEIRCYEQESGEFKIKFRNIPFSKGIISTVQKEEVQKQTEKKEISKEVLKKVEVENFTFELTNCKISSGGNVTCDLLITNNDKDRELIFFTKRSRMFDDFGNEYEPSKGELANKQVGSRSDARSLLISGIPTKASLTFKNVTQEASGISLLEIRCYEQESGEFKIKFRNIPLSK